MGIVFQHITEARICELVSTAKDNVNLYTPGLTTLIVFSLLKVAERGVTVRVFVDISQKGMRLGFLDEPTLHFLKRLLEENAAIELFNMPGIRQGVLVIDKRSWAFAVHIKSIEGFDSPCWEFPNGLEFVQLPSLSDVSPLEMKAITPDELGKAIEALQTMDDSNVGGLGGDMVLPDAEELARRIEELDEREKELNKREAELDKKEKEIEQNEKQQQEFKHHYEERCRLKRIDFSVKNYKIQNCTLKLKPELLINIEEAKKIKMTYPLYDKGEKLPDVKVEYTLFQKERKKSTR